VLVLGAIVVYKDPLKLAAVPAGLAFAFNVDKARVDNTAVDEPPVQVPSDVAFGRVHATVQLSTVICRPFVAFLDNSVDPVTASESPVASNDPPL